METPTQTQEIPEASLPDMLADTNFVEGMGMIKDLSAQEQAAWLMESFSAGVLRTVAMQMNRQSPILDVVRATTIRALAERRRADKAVLAAMPDIGPHQKLRF